MGGKICTSQQRSLGMIPFFSIRGKCLTDLRHHKDDPIHLWVDLGLAWSAVIFGTVAAVGFASWFFGTHCGIWFPMGVHY